MNASALKSYSRRPLRKSVSLVAVDLDQIAVLEYAGLIDDVNFPHAFLSVSLSFSLCCLVSPPFAVSDHCVCSSQSQVAMCPTRTRNKTSKSTLRFQLSECDAQALFPIHRHACKSQ